MLNLISHKPDIDEIYLYGKDVHKEKYQLLINKLEGAGMKHFNDYETFIEYLNDMNVIYENIQGYNSNKKL